MTPLPADAQAILASFLQRFIADREAGGTVSLAEYQARFPGYEAAIAAEFARLTGTAAAATGADSGSPAGPAAGIEVDPIRGSAAERYRDEGEIARGGMGTIHRVWDPSLRRVVAKKVLARGTDAAAGGLLRFLEEAQITAQLDHPGIVPVHELGVDGNGRYYFTMPLVRGEDLRKVIERLHGGDAAWSLPRAIAVVQRVCDAVAFAHDKGVIHRDLKPANVMVGRFGETYVMDWGLASVRDDGRTHVADLPADATAAVRSPRRELAGELPVSPFLTREGDVVGTPAYMAPEQAAGDSASIGPRSDVYSIGAMLYHLLAGRMPYGDAGSTTWQDVLDASRSGPPTPLHRVCKHAPVELLAIVDQAMARDPDRRYPTAKALGQDLGAFLEGRVVRAHATGALAELRKWVRRNRLAAAAAAAALLSLAGGLGASLHLANAADHQATLANAGYLGALDAVERMLSRMAVADLRQLPGGEEIRRFLLEDARQLLERFVAEHSDQQEGRFQLGKAYGQLGSIHGSLGEADKARQHYQLAEQVFAGLVAADPDATDACIQWIVWRAALARAADREDRPDDALRLLTDSAAQLDRLLVLHPEKVELHVQRATCDSELAVVHHRRGRRDVAHTHTQAAYDRLERILDHPDAELRRRGTFLAVAIDHATSLAQSDRLDAAESVLARTREVLARYRDADDRSAATYFARMHQATAYVAQRRGDAGAAAASLDQAIACLRKLTTSFPLDPVNWVTLGQCLHNRAVGLHQDGDPEAALELVDEALRIDERLLQREAGNRQYLDQRYHHLRGRLGLLLALGQHAAIAETADQLTALAPNAAAAWRLTAEVLCGAAALAVTDTLLVESERQHRRDLYVQQGVDHCRRAFAIEGGEIRWFANACFDAVREHPQFVALVAELRARTVDGKVAPTAATGR